MHIQTDLSENLNMRTSVTVTMRYTCVNKCYDMLSNVSAQVHINNSSHEPSPAINRCLQVAPVQRRGQRKDNDDYKWPKSRHRMSKGLGRFRFITGTNEDH